ncbi:hypothetical protein DFH08DRAFT_633407, partial [Mycena albidolilacea]
YFTKYFIAKNKQAQKVVEHVSTEFKLNTEQDRAFKIVANHAIAENPEQLKMYLGGVGGTGKSGVIKALVKFFEGREESHKFLVLGPTGTSAAQLGGSTYNSVLGIRDNLGHDVHEENGIRNVRERLRGVEYIFLDEISMVSCAALYAISARL